MEENNNTFVSSRGILKSCDYYSQKPQSSTKLLHTYLPLDKIRSMKNPSIYICSRAVLHFIAKMLPLIGFSFILVSGDCDETIPDEVLTEDILNKLLNDSRMIHWFCQNMTIEHNKVTRIPIGLDYHTLTRIPLWGPLSSCNDQEKILFMVKKISIPFWHRNIKCYSNFHFTMKSKFGYDRIDARREINTELIYYQEKKLPRPNTWLKQKDYAFVISPHGDGLDCHRTWEALCLGCIPIVKTSLIDKVYDNLPVLIVKDWKDITRELLNSTIIQFKAKSINNEFNIDKLNLSYWMGLINSYK
jgi:hypothetical protein